MIKIDLAIAPDTTYVISRTQYVVEESDPAYDVIATVPAGVEVFEDTDVEPRVAYRYYVTRVVNGTARTSHEYVLCDYGDTGPGPKEFIYGDWAFGYFGILSGDDLPTEAAITAALDALFPGDVRAARLSAITATWHKFAVDGEVCYFPENTQWFLRTTAATGAFWQTCYEASIATLIGKQTPPTKAGWGEPSAPTPLRLDGAAFHLGLVNPMTLTGAAFDNSAFSQSPFSCPSSMLAFMTTVSDLQDVVEGDDQGSSPGRLDQFLLGTIAEGHGQLASLTQSKVLTFNPQACGAYVLMGLGLRLV